MRPLDAFFATLVGAAATAALNIAVDWGNDVPAFLMFLVGSILCFTVVSGVAGAILAHTVSTAGRLRGYAFAAAIAFLLVAWYHSRVEAREEAREAASHKPAILPR